MNIFNTLTRKIQPLSPLKPGRINMFVCGPTVYDLIHPGNARTFVIFDTLAKYLRFRGFDTYYLQNITDIDDKIITRAFEDGVTPKKIADQYTEEFFKDMQAIGIDGVSLYAKASDHIAEIIGQIERLADKGYAYSAPAVEVADQPGGVKSENNFDVYFDIAKYEADFPNQYGKLSGQITEENEIGTRKEIEANKRNPRDFVLWKAQNFTYEPAWDSPWGKGRPGWHIEDTAISERLFGPQYDIHGGAQDLMFPHHEAEIAQQQAASAKVPFVQIWMHAGFLVTQTEKMSKSLKNTFSLRTLIEAYGRPALRLYFLSAHYRSPLDFSEDSIKQYQAGVKRISAFKSILAHASGSNNPSADAYREKIREDFIKSLDEDFDTPTAIAHLFTFIRNINTLISGKALSSVQASELLNTFNELADILGINPEAKEQIPAEIAGLIEKREILRADKNWDEADEIRDQVRKLGYEIEDTPYGPVANKI